MTIIQEHIQNVQSGTINIIDKTKEVLKLIAELDKETHGLSSITTELAMKCAEFVHTHPKKESLQLAGVFISVKDCILIKDVESTASSRILKGYHPVFDATVIEKIKNAGGIIIGKTIQDEFGFGSFSTNVGLDYLVPRNPLNKNHSTGGSSGGSAVITKLCEIHNIPHISIAESTGGSIECPASFCGVIGFCPTYGKVSRNGLISYANSLDKIGVMTSKIEDTIIAINCISGKDENDSTSVKSNELHNISINELSQKKLKIGIITESLTDTINQEVKIKIEEKIELFKKLGHTIEKVSLPFTFEYGIPAYYILAMSEASTNLASLCGLRYGKQDLQANEHFSQYFTRIRSEHFGKEAKRRIMLGTFTRNAGYRDAFYIKAAKARTKVIQEYQKLFKEFDVLLSPTMPFTSPSFENISSLKPIDHYLADIMTVGPNLAGIPHATFPVGTNQEGLPIGMMIIANHFQEEKVLAVGKILEENNE